MGDFIGDWREELLMTASDGQALQLYTTTIPTDHRICTLTHDPQYRLAIAWQKVVYNKPLHPGFFLGHGMAPPPRPVSTSSARAKQSPVWERKISNLELKYFGIIMILADNQV